MATFYDELSEEHSDFINEQKLFFTATAPTSGRINLSPKGMDSFRVLNANQVAYLDLTGSGNESSAHLEENGRMTIMFCSFSRKPRILRLYGVGEVIRQRDPRWAEYSELFPSFPGVRQVILLSVQSVQTSCGYAVPVYDLVEERQTLLRYSEKKGEDGMLAYQKEKNQVSIDGLPTLLFQESEAAKAAAAEEAVAEEAEAAAAEAAAASAAEEAAQGSE